MRDITGSSGACAGTSCGTDGASSVDDGEKSVIADAFRGTNGTSSADGGEKSVIADAFLIAACRKKRRR
jgi:hypothetical protein